MELLLLISVLVLFNITGGESEEDCSKDLSRPLSECISLQKPKPTASANDMVEFRCMRGNVYKRYGDVHGFECECMDSRTFNNKNRELCG